VPRARSVDGVARLPAPPVPAGAARYLETIYYLEAEGEVARPSRLAAWMDVSRPSVTEMLHRLRDAGLVIGDGRAGISLSEEGRQVAEGIVRRHRILEVWLTETLGLDWVRADSEAHHLAGALSDTVLERLDVSLGRPTTCPHGNLVPGRVAGGPGARPLASLPTGSSGRLVRISELAEREAPSVLAFLESVGLAPGRTLVVVARSPTGETEVRLESSRQQTGRPRGDPPGRPGKRSRAEVPVARVGVGGHAAPADGPGAPGAHTLLLDAAITRILWVASPDATPPYSDAGAAAPASLAPATTRPRESPRGEEGHPGGAGRVVTPRPE
jgi:DtxR family Mn-dependent transcriptional regulator